MIAEINKQLIESCLDAYANELRAQGLMKFPVKEPPFPPRSGGVPPAMVSGEIDDEGWVEWKMLPSTMTEADVLTLEAKLPGPFPPLFRAYLTTRFTLDMDWHGIRLPALPCDNPFGALKQLLEAWSAPMDAGYVAFAEDGNDTGPLCFDFFNRLADGDCPVVLFDHEHLINLGDSQCREREKVEPYAIAQYASFHDLMEELRSGQSDA